MTILKQLIEISVDSDVFDLTSYTGSDDEDNGMWYVAEEIVSEIECMGYGVTAEIIPGDPRG